MIVEHQPGRILVIKESFPFLRNGSFACLGLAVVVGAFLWFESPDTLRDTKGIGWAALAVGLFCAGGLAVDDRRFVFDAPRKTVTWHRRNAFRVREGEIPFSEIHDVVITSDRTRDDDETKAGYSLRYSVALVTSGGVVPLTSMFGRDRQEFTVVADAALDMLAAPEGPSRSDVARLVAAGRVIDAVALVRRERGVDLPTARAIVDGLKRREKHE